MVSRFFGFRMRFAALVCFAIAIITVGLLYHFPSWILEEQEVKGRLPLEKGVTNTSILWTGSIASPLDGSIHLVCNRQELWSLSTTKHGLYAAGGGGLIHWPSGKTAPLTYDIRHGLPENPLRSVLFVGESLFIGTSSSGLVELRGKRIAHWQGLQGPALSIRCFLGDNRDLLIGTYGAGVYRKKGESLVFYGPPGDEGHSLRVTSIAGRIGAMALGSFSHGLFIEEHGSWRRLRADRLGADEVLAVASWNEGWAVGTPFGLVHVSGAGEKVKVLLPDGFVTAIHSHAGELWIGTLADGVYRIGPRGRSISQRIVGGGTFPHVHALTEHEGRMYAATTQGLLSWDGKAWAKDTSLSAGLIENHVSALACDDQGRVWVGTFRSGIEIWSADLQTRLGGLRDEALREINHIAWDPKDCVMWVSSSAGAHRFRGLHREAVLSVDQGLVSASVSAVLPQNNRVLFATAGGLSWNVEGETRSLYAFHGLVNNHCYSLAYVGDTLFVGTLGGLSLIRGNKVVGRVTAATSALPRNWITALLASDEGLYLGTYGGGLARRDQEGKIHAIAPELGNFEVNFNALLLLPGQLLAGTLDQGIAVINRSTGRGHFYRRGVGSRNVTAMATKGRWLYIGSDGGVTRMPIKRFK